MTNYSFCKFKIPEKGGKVIWEITNECNYGCKYCIFSSTGRKPEGELNYEQIHKALLELKESNFTHIKFTGGEPFLRPDMINILLSAHQLGFTCDVSTNASKITEEIAQRLKLIHLDFVHVSLDGADLASHEAVRGKKSFSPTVEGIKKLRKFDVPLRIGCVIHEHNENRLEDIILFCESYNIKNIAFSMMEPVGRLKDKTSHLAKKPIEELAQELSRLQKKYSHMSISHNLQSIQKIEFMNKPLGQKEEYAACPAGTKFLFINSLGIVSPCTWISEHKPQYVGGKIQDSCLKDILSSTSFQNMHDLFEKAKELQICPMSDLTTLHHLENAIHAASITSHDRKFDQVAPIYRFTTENLSYLKKIKFKDRAVLTVGGSYDHAINCFLLGADTVDNIDINICAKFYADFKHHAVILLNYSQYQELFFSKNEANRSKYFSLVTQALPIDSKNFFSHLEQRFTSCVEDIFSSHFFHQRQYEQELHNNLYLENEYFYRKAQDILKHKRVSFFNQNITEVPSRLYDVILLSNISDYSHKMFPEQLHIEKFKNNIVLPFLSALKTNGLCMFAYVFDSLDVFQSSKRNIFNDSKVRQQHYSSIEHYLYQEMTIKSSIHGAIQDSICLLINLKEL